MATIAHCLYCFESLDAYLSRRPALSLAEVEKSWAEYVREAEADGPSASKQSPAFRRLGAALSGTSASGLSTPSSVSTTSLGPDTPATSTSSLSDANGKSTSYASAAAAAASTLTESPLFITWNTISPHDSNHRSLRGCIGTFEDQELDDGLSSYAVTSAVHDTRFEPITRSELPSLEVVVTLLMDFEECDGPEDWEIGTHGLRISFTYHDRRFGATYLPDVATEQGWTKEETLVSLMRKAGWMGRKDRWRDVPLKCVRYQGKKESVEYEVYKEWRDWLKERKATT